MNKIVVLIGIGEMGGVFARGILKTGYTVYPVTRGMDIKTVIQDVPDPHAVVVAVGEKDLQNVLASLPTTWHDRLVLLQNELLPGDWIKHNIENPTVISVWFEKKQGQEAKYIIPSPVFGPLDKFIEQALRALNIQCNVLRASEELVFELVVKNVYILTTNIAGLEVGGTVGELLSDHQELAKTLAGEVMDIQFKLIGQELDRIQIIESMVYAFYGDPGHKCMGRCAPARLARAIAQADEFGLEASRLRKIYQHQAKAAV